MNAKCNPLRRSRDACNQGFPQRNSDSDVCFFLVFTRLLIILLQSGDLAGCFCLIYVLLPFLSFLSFSVSPLSFMWLLGFDFPLLSFALPVFIFFSFLLILLIMSINN